MKKQCKPILFLATNVLLVLNLLVYFAIRSMWSGIVRYTFKPMPYILLAVLVITALVSTILSMNKKYPRVIYIWSTIYIYRSTIQNIYLKLLETQQLNQKKSNKKMDTGLE